MTEGAAIKRRELKAHGARVWRPEGPPPPPRLSLWPLVLWRQPPLPGAFAPCPQFRKTLTATLTGLQSNHEAFGLRFPLVEIGVALAVLVNIPSGNPWEKLLRDCLRLSWLLLFQTRIWSLSQKKMKRTKHVRFQEEVNVAKETTSQTADTQDTSSVTEVALALAKDVIAAAVQSVKEAENPIKNIDWVTHGEFTAETGRKQIEQFVLKWEYHSRWVHYTDFLRREDMGHSIFHYIYCVRWSIPTAQIPIAQITAGVYFTIKIHKKKPPDTPIDVSYVFEGQSLVHRPGMIRFREKWLRDIIEAKCILINPNMFQFNSIGIFQNIVGLDF